MLSQDQLFIIPEIEAAFHGRSISISETEEIEGNPHLQFAYGTIEDYPTLQSYLQEISYEAEFCEIAAIYHSYEYNSNFKETERTGDSYEYANRLLNDIYYRYDSQLAQARYSEV